MTNYDRIKSMSVEEMATMIDNGEDELICAPCNPKYCDGYGDGEICTAENSRKRCHAATVKWLESEVE